MTWTGVGQAQATNTLEKKKRQQEEIRQQATSFILPISRLLTLRRARHALAEMRATLQRTTCMLSRNASRHLVTSSRPNFAWNWASAIKATLPRVTQQSENSLTDFNSFTPEQVESVWDTVTDEPYGGSSTCSFRVIPAREGSEDVAVARAVFEGNISLKKKTAKMKNTGFAAVHHVLPWYLQDISDYEALAIRVKTDGRKYIMNLQVETFIPDDLYQGFLEVPPNKWVTARLPFKSFLLTAKGSTKEEQRVLDGNNLKTIGLSIQDGIEGPFRLELEWIKVLHDIRSPVS